MRYNYLQMFMKLLEIDPQGIRIADLSVMYPDYSSVSVSDTKLVHPRPDHSRKFC
jgi:hypothetical protein